MRLITKTLTVLLISLAVAKAQSIEPFVVEDIQVEGLQRVELGTFFTTLPIRVGETLDEARVPNIIRAVYKTGNFDFVKLEKEGQKLKIYVVERPVISQIVISGNKVIKTEQLLDNMKKSGVSKGDILDSFVLDKIEQGVTNEYHSNGHYHLNVKKRVIEQSRNRVRLRIAIEEGSSARIKNINFVGNKVFNDDELLSQMELQPGGIVSYFKKEKYSAQKLDKDLETIESYYRDRGYLKFTIDNVGVSLSEDKESVYVTINVIEGDVFKVNKIKFIGDLKFPLESFERLLPFQKGDTYSQAIVTFVEEQSKILLGYGGYSFAEVSAFPEIDEDNDEVDLNFVIQAGERYYANKIAFKGNYSTDESVLRKEVRLQEGTPISSTSVERSKTRIQQLPFIEEVDVEINKTEELGLADIIYTLKERNSSEATLSLGYNDVFGFQLQGGITQRNFLGEGKTLGINLSTNRAVNNVSLNYADPYFFADTIGLNTSFSYRETDFSEFNQVGRSLDTLSLGAGINYAISEISNVTLGLNLQDNTLNSPIQGGQQDQRIIDFFETLGSDARQENSVDFDIISANIAYQSNTLNRFIFPTSGFRHTIGLEVATPLGDVEYFKANYDYRHYFPINDDWIFLIRANLGYGDGLNDTDRLPYFANFYAGGSTSLRGFEANTIGPKSILRQIQTLPVGSPIPGVGVGPIILPPENDLLFINNNFSVGGNAKAVGSFEFIFPTPFAADNKNVRTSLFVDVGNVWDTKFNKAKFNGLGFVPGSSTSIADFSDSSNYRGSYGISLQWWSPFAPMQFSLSKTFKSQEFDETETFSFILGQTF